VVERHEILGITTCVVAAATAVMSEVSRRRTAWRRWYRWGLLAAAVVVSATGYYGGILVYGVGHYSW
jgi:hypothetical protein